MRYGGTYGNRNPKRRPRPERPRIGQPKRPLNFTPGDDWTPERIEQIEALRVRYRAALAEFNAAEEMRLASSFKFADAVDEVRNIKSALDRVRGAW